MRNDDQRALDPAPQPGDVVVTTSTPAGGAPGTDVAPEATRVDVYSSTTPTADDLAAEREARALRIRRMAERRQQLTVAKAIDVCWFLFSLLEVLLALRFFFELTAAHAAAGFVALTYGITEPFVWPFAGIFGVPRSGNNVFDANLIIAMVIYAVIAWGITRLLAMLIEPPPVV